jgi:hypothetical protein
MLQFQPGCKVLVFSFDGQQHSVTCFVCSCISVGTRTGYKIYNCEPFGRCFHESPGGIGVVEMLFCTSLVALVGAGEKVSQHASMHNAIGLTVVCFLFLSSLCLLLPVPYGCARVHAFWCLAQRFCPVHVFVVAFLSFLLVAI